MLILTQIYFVFNWKAKIELLLCFELKGCADCVIVAVLWLAVETELKADILLERILSTKNDWKNSFWNYTEFLFLCFSLLMKGSINWWMDHLYIIFFSKAIEKLIWELIFSFMTCNNVFLINARTIAKFFVFRIWIESFSNVPF
jgi:hypothetical protein